MNEPFNCPRCDAPIPETIDWSFHNVDEVVTCSVCGTRAKLDYEVSLDQHGDEDTWFWLREA